MTIPGLIMELSVKRSQPFRSDKISALSSESDHSRENGVIRDRGGRIDWRRVPVIFSLQDPLKIDYQGENRGPFIRCGIIGNDIPDCGQLSHGRNTILAEIINHEVILSLP
jgi:hypothetical protein